MPLLPLDAFAPVFEPLQGKRIGYVRSPGNVGDLLIQAAMFQLFAAFGIRWHLADVSKPPRADELVFAGGGNMGTLYPKQMARRKQALAWGLPLTILPQSFTSREDLSFKQVWIRERASRCYRQDALLAPDLALGLDYDCCTEPQAALGIFLRRDKEHLGPRPWFIRDPAKICATPFDYLELAARYERIITDRLHFAICGLIVGRDTTLLANSYHKNASMHETWLASLGCKFATNLQAARRIAA